MMENQNQPRLGFGVRPYMYMFRYHWINKICFSSSNSLISSTSLSLSLRKSIKMSAPAWLPPSNSHLNRLTVSIDQHKLPPLKEDAYSLIDIHASAAFVTKPCPIQRTFCGLNLRGKLYYSYDLLSSSPSEIKEFISWLVYCLRVPVNLDRVVLQLRHFEEIDNFSISLEENVDNWAVRIQEFLGSMRSKSYNAGHKKLPFRLEIRKKIWISEEEYKAWTTWYEEKKKVDPNFERDYNRAISRRRTKEELWYEEALKRKAAAQSAMEKILKDVSVDDSNSSGSCVVCLEELEQGSKAVSLPCFDVFHRNCIVKWLRESHKCPLCMYMLPPVDDA